MKILKLDGLDVRGVIGVINKNNLDRIQCIKLQDEFNKFDELH